ncbi:hypothetical protein FRP1_00200 [Pseudonocardia sp. EC080625-04]|nr:hypothetical protein FRP1_00200 [Pseudonocardia sp. EC080625-04]
MPGRALGEVAGDRAVDMRLQHPFHTERGDQHQGDGARQGEQSRVRQHAAQRECRTVRGGADGDGQSDLAPPKQAPVLGPGQHTAAQDVVLDGLQQRVAKHVDPSPNRVAPRLLGDAVHDQVRGLAAGALRRTRPGRDYPLLGVDGQRPRDHQVGQLRADQPTGEQVKCQTGPSGRLVERDQVQTGRERTVLHVVIPPNETADAP